MKYPEIKKALVLDLDGTVRRCKSGKPFIEEIDDIELMPGIENLMRRYADMGYLILGVSNQGGVAHGFKSPERVQIENDRMISLFKPYKGRPCPFHSIKSCFHDPTGNYKPYNIRSLSRKPDIGLLVMHEMEAWVEGYVMIDWDNSVMVGDRPEDEECAKRAGITRYYHIDTFLNMPHEFTIG